MMADSSKNMLWRWVGDDSVYGVVVINQNNPKPNEMTEHVSELAPIGRRLKGFLVYTFGGAPNALQRKQLREGLQSVFGDNHPPSSIVMTGSVVVRTAITALNLFSGNRLKAFGFHELEEAFQYIKAPQEMWTDIKKNIDEMKAELGLPRD